MCNECKFQTGFWERNVGVETSWPGYTRNQSVGTAKVPVVKSRQRAFHNVVERYLPGLFPYDGDELPPIRKVYRNHHMSVENYTHYSVRCPGCQTWQELAAFRTARHYKCKPHDPLWWRSTDHPDFEAYRCNRCVAKTSGVRELEKQLLEFWTALVKMEIERLEYPLLDGWRYLGNGNASLKVAWEQMRRDESLGLDHEELPASLKEVGSLDLATRRRCFEMWKRYWEENGFGVLGDLASNKWFRQWHEGYEAVEKRLLFLEACNDKVKMHPGILVEYALGSDDDGAV